MPKFLIEREIAGAGKLSAPELQGSVAEVVQRLAAAGPADSVGAELRNRRQDLLRLHRS